MPTDPDVINYGQQIKTPERSYRTATPAPVQRTVAVQELVPQKMRKKVK